MYVRSVQVVRVPEGLAAIPAGPELAAALHALPLSQIPNDRMLDVLTAQYRQLSHTQAAMAAVLTELARCPGHTTPGQIVRTDEPDRYACEETRAALRWTRRSADGEHELAESVVLGMPELFAAWSAGAVDRPRVRVFDQYLTGLSTGQVDRICRVAVPRAPRLTTGQLAHLLRRMVIAVDPDAAARWYRHGIRDRNVTAYPAPDGTITIAANGLPADQAEAACERVQQLAAAAKRAGHPGLIGQIRCDLFLGLLDGRFHGMTTPQVIAALIADYHPTGEPAAGSTATGSGHADSGRPDEPTCDGATDPVPGDTADSGAPTRHPTAADGRRHRRPPTDTVARRATPQRHRPLPTSPTPSLPSAPQPSTTQCPIRGWAPPARGRLMPTPAISGSASRSGSGWPPCWATTSTRPRSPALDC